MYKFSDAVNEEISLYGRYYYYTEATGIRVSAIEGFRASVGYTGEEITQNVTLLNRKCPKILSWILGHFSFSGCSYFVSCCTIRINITENEERGRK